ncbi:MAG: transposase [Synergistaceae bacterium]|nr:transposase [Synergistaceae bacterium]
MSASRRKFDEDFKKNAVKLSYASPKTIREVSGDLGITDSMLYRWRSKYTMGGDKTRNATLEFARCLSSRVSPAHISRCVCPGHVFLPRHCRRPFHHPRGPHHFLHHGQLAGGGEDLHSQCCSASRTW